MPGKRIKDLTALSGAGSANNDDVVIFDTNADTTKRISRSQLAEGMIGDLPFLYFHGVLTADPTQRFNGDSLELGDGYLRSSDMIFRYYTSSGWQNYEQISIAAAQAWAEGTLPGGAGTYSSKEWSETSEAWAEGTLPGGAGTYSSREWSDTSEAWATNPENTAVELGKYSALHYAAKAQGYANVAGAAAGFFDRENAIAVTTDTTLTYTAGQPGTVAAGDIIRTRAEGFAYEVAASGATDQHVTTAGSVKLYVLPDAGGFHTKAFGAVGDGVSNDAVMVQAALRAAHAGGHNIVFDAGVYFINTAVSLVYKGHINITSNGDAELVFGAGVSGAVAFNLQASSATTTTLASPVAYGDTSITVTDATSIEVGQLVVFSTSTPVDTAYSYSKGMTLIVAGVSGTTVYLSEPANFQFTVAETTVGFRDRATADVSNLKIRQIATKRFDLNGVQNVRWSNMVTEGPAKDVGDVVFISVVHNFFGKNCTAIYGRYNYNCSNWSRHIYFDQAIGISAGDFCDFNVWSYDCRVSNFFGFDMSGALSPHPCFEVHYENVYIETSGTGGIDLRTFGGSVKNCRIVSRGGVGGGIYGAFPRADYLYMRQYYNFEFENINAPGVIIGGAQCQDIFVRNCQVYNVSLDGAANGILGSIYIDDKTTTVVSRVGLRRVPRVSLQLPVWKPIVDDYASDFNIKDITGITQANPAVVTAVLHGFSNDNYVRIDGVAGMTAVNEIVFQIKNVTTDTFELYASNGATPVDATGYTAYTSGGKATKHIVAKSVDVAKAPIVGDTPNMHFRTVLRQQISGVGVTTLTIPVKIVNYYDIQEANGNLAIVTLRTYSPYSGSSIVKYNLNTGFVNSLSAVTASTAATGATTLTMSNARYHYGTQVTAEGGDSTNDIAKGQFYVTFNVVVTVTSTTHPVNYVELEFEQVRFPAP